jgi:glycosyltransferase involved in cell wall biosynthesis
MRVFMLGWEFPPHISGGLGTACYGMTKGLDEIGVGVCFVLPTAVPVGGPTHVELRSPADLSPEGAEAVDGPTRMFHHVELHRVPAALSPYATPAAHDQAVESIARRRSESRARKRRAKQAAAAPAPPPMPEGTFTVAAGAHYTGDLMGEINRYARLAVELARSEAFDVIHAHDWMTFPAGMAVAAATRKPLVIHVHSTEFDRSGEHVDQRVYDIERMGMHVADRVVCVSHLTRRIVTSRYGVPAEKTEVVYNAANLPSSNDWQMKPIKQDEKIVLFLGRVTMQKGPEYFLRAAKKVVEKFQNVRFVMAGSGDMMTQCVQEVADLRLGRYVTFTGFLRGADVDRIFSMADLYVMPSVSEPFGIAPLEALGHDVPVIISRQSGVSEVLSHVLKVDFWDIDEMANKILAVLNHPPLQKTLRQHGRIELRKFSWRDSAEKLKEIYAKAIAAAA